MSLTAVSLFTGVGGLDIGLERAGFTTLLMCEADPWKRSVLAAHWPEVPLHDDVRTLDDAPPADLVHGGFPCQDVSVAGRRAGLAGERTGLYFDALRIVDAVRPRSVLLENVPGLLSSNGGRDFGVVLAELADRGYGVAWRVVDAQHFGVPQRRRRVFVLALAGDDPRAAAERAGQVLALRESGSGHPATSDEARPRATAGAASGARAGRVVGSLTGTGPGGGWRIGADEAAAGHLVPVAPYLGADGRVNGSVTAKWAKGSGGPAGDEAYNLIAYRKSARVNADPDSAETWVDDGVANTLNTFDTGDVRTTHAIVEPAANGVRRLTPVECERLMGWPDDWTAPRGVNAPDSRRYAACGDGVVAPVAEWIGRRLAHALESHKCARR